MLACHELSHVGGILLSYCSSLMVLNLDTLQLSANIVIFHMDIVRAHLAHKSEIYYILLNQTIMVIHFEVAACWN